MLQKQLEEVVQAVRGVAPQAWEIAVRQVVIEAVCTLIGWLAVAWGLVVLAKWFGGRSKNARDESDAVLLKAMSVVTVCVAVGAVVASVSSLVPQLITPEYYAAQNILSAIKP